MQKADADKQRHATEMAAYVPPTPPPMSAAPAPKKDPNAPKGPLTAYMLWCKEARPGILEEHPDYAVPEMGKAHWLPLYPHTTIPL